MKIPVKIQLKSNGVYSNDTILDMYNDESVVLKDVLKDLNDPKKLFTGFSRSFTVPASKRNNKLFKHYYNINLNDGLDSRSYIDARILMSDAVYKVGNVSVEGVKMNAGKPDSYSIRFYGNLTELSKKIGLDELRSLDLVSSDISNFDAEAEFGDNTKRDVVFPLSSRSDRFIVDTTNTLAESLDDVRNIWYHGTTFSDSYGLNESYLVGAISVGKLLDSISAKYGLSFSGVFEQNYVRDLYLWLKSTEDTSSGMLDEVTASDIAYASGATSFSELNVSSTSIIPQSTQGHLRRYVVKIKATTSAADFKASVKVDGVSAIETTTSGVWTSFTIPPNLSTITFTATSATPDVIDCDIQIDKQIAVGQWNSIESTFLTCSMDVGNANYYSIGNNMPKMKITDFLGSLFKMFNIIAEVDESLNISTKHYDYFMSEGTVKDVTQYVKQDKYSVSKGNIYSSLSFSFADTKTIMEEGYTKVNGKDYGELAYELRGEDNTRLIGQEYKLEVKNQRIPLEALLDASSGENRYMNYIQFSDAKGAEQKISPCFTYIWAHSGSAKDVAWNNGTAVSRVNEYIMPSNLFSNHTEPTTTNSYVSIGLHFSSEVNEYTLHEFADNGLFGLFYEGLTSLMFNQNTRSVKLDAYLPQSVLFNLKLSDTLRIANNNYLINSIETNYMNGLSKLDLTLVNNVGIEAFNLKTDTYRNTGDNAEIYTYLNSEGYIQSGALASGDDEEVTSIGRVKSSSIGSITELGLAADSDVIYLRYSLSSSTVCGDSQLAVYGADKDAFINGDDIFSDSDLTILANSGWYSNGTDKRQWDGTNWLSTLTSCGTSGTSVSLRHSSSSSSVCTALSVTYYSSVSNPITTGDSIYTDTSLTTLAPAQWYSDGINRREWSGSAWLGSSVSCGATAQTLTLKTSSDSSLVCSASTTTVYSTSVNALTDGSNIYSNSSMTVLAPANWYSDGSFRREWNGTSWLVFPAICS